MISRFGLYVIASRKNAAWVALVLALLPFLGLPTGWLCAVLVGLITLRLGAKEGLIVLAWIALPGIALSFLGNSLLLLNMVLLRCGIIWLLALMLRRTASWALTLQLASFIAIIAIAILHSLVPDVAAWWSNELVNFWQNLNVTYHLGMDAEQIQKLSQLSKFIDGIFAAFLLSMDWMTLMIARWWQAKLYYPGGFKKEFHQIRMGYAASVVLILGGLFAFLQSAFALDILPVLLWPFAIAGLSLVHALVANKNQKLMLLIGFYILLMLFFPYVLGLLAFMALIDSWYDFRYRRVTAVSR